MHLTASKTRRRTKTKGNVWDVRYRDADGKQRTETFPVEDAADERIKELRDGRWYVAPPQRLGDFLEGHLEREQNRVKPSTWKRNREALRALGVLNK